MSTVVPGYEYDIFISYRHNDNLDGWVTDFVQNLSNPFAQKFIKTREFKDLFDGYDGWSKDMISRIQRMN